VAYIVQADVVPRRLTEKELVELTDDAGTGEVDSTVVAQILNEASGKIDSYVAGKYTLPLAVTEQVKGLAVDIAAFLLFQRRRRMQPEIQTAYEEAMKFLKDVSAGRATLDQAALLQRSEMDVKKRDHTTDPEAFDNTKLEGF